MESSFGFKKNIHSIHFIFIHIFSLNLLCACLTACLWFNTICQCSMPPFKCFEFFLQRTNNRQKRTNAFNTFRLDDIYLSVVIFLKLFLCGLCHVISSNNLFGSHMTIFTNKKVWLHIRQLLIHIHAYDY